MSQWGSLITVIFSYLKTQIIEKNESFSPYIGWPTLRVFQSVECDIKPFWISDHFGTESEKVRGKRRHIGSPYHRRPADFFDPFLNKIIKNRPRFRRRSTRSRAAKFVRCADSSELRRRWETVVTDLSSDGTIVEYPNDQRSVSDFFNSTIKLLFLVSGFGQRILVKWVPKCLIIRIIFLVIFFGHLKCTPLSWTARRTILNWHLARAMLGL